MRGRSDDFQVFSLSVGPRRSELGREQTRGREETVGSAWDLVSGRRPLDTWEELSKGNWQSSLYN